MKNVWKWKFAAWHLDYIQLKWALNIVNYIVICMVKWLFARNDVIIEKAMSHILRTRQAFDLTCGVFLFTFKSGLLLKYHAPKKPILPFQFPFNKSNAIGYSTAIWGHQHELLLNVQSLLNIKLLYTNCCWMCELLFNIQLLCGTAVRIFNQLLDGWILEGRKKKL